MIAAGEATRGREFIIACGGDGTISEVANGILDSGEDVELGVLPSGTGGDFRRTLGIPSHAADAALALRRGRSRHIDVGRVSYLDHDGEPATRCFLNIASFGISGRVVDRVREKNMRWVPTLRAGLLGGKLAYAAAAVEAIVSTTNPIVQIRLDKQIERRLTMANLCVANARYFGGGMKIAPEAKLNDGLLDVVAIGDLSALAIFTNAYRIYLGTHLGMQQVHHTRARHISIRPADSSAEIEVEADGELLGRLPATFEIQPHGLRVRVPV